MIVPLHAPKVSLVSRAVKDDRNHAPIRGASPNLGQCSRPWGNIMFEIDEPLASVPKLLERIPIVVRSLTKHLLHVEVQRIGSVWRLVGPVMHPLVRQGKLGA